MPLLLCKAIHNIKQNIVPQMNFSSSILLFLFHIFGPDPEIIRFRYSEPKNSKSYSRSILLRTKKKKRKKKTPVQLTEFRVVRIHPEILRRNDGRK